MEGEVRGSLLSFHPPPITLSNILDTEEAKEHLVSLFQD